MKDKTKEKWKDVGRKVAKIGLPLLGSVLGGPAGGTIGSTVASALGVNEDNPDAVMKALESDTDAAVKLAQIEADHKEELEKIQLGYADLEVERLKAVNATMRVEAQSDHWWVSGWRPFNGYAFGLTLFFVYVVLPFWKPWGIIIPEIPELVFASWVSVLGVAVWDRGKEKRIKHGEDYKGFGGWFGNKKD